MTSYSQHDTNPPPPSDDLDGTLVVEEPRFAIIPEWVIDADIPDAAFRLYSLLLRYGNGSGSRMPSRPTLARRLRRSVDAVDRAMRQLSEAGIVRIEHRRSGDQFLSNRYHVRTSTPAHGASEGGSRKSAATPESPVEGGRNSAATPGRRSAARVAANVRPYREISTERRPPPPTPPAPAAQSAAAASPTAVEVADHELLGACGITDVEALAKKCAASRRALGKPTARWTARCLTVVVRLAVIGKGWPAEVVEEAILAVARDPQTHSPARVAEAGPWWDAVVVGADLRLDAKKLTDLEWRLSESGGLRPLLQAQARQELSHEGLPITRHTVGERACSILDCRPTTNATSTSATSPDDPSTTEAETLSTSNHQAPEGISR